MTSSLRPLAALVLALLLVSFRALADDAHGTHAADAGVYAEELQGYVPGASALEGRILAPCCWNQTLDIHGSEVSNTLRREIRERLSAGESAETIETSLVERYGPRILAVPPGSPLKGVAAVLALAMVAAGVLGFVMLRRWRARGEKSAHGREAKSEPRDAQLDARLDAELRALDD